MPEKMYYSTIQELIDQIETKEISYRNLHTTFCIRQNNEVIQVPYKSMIREYMDLMAEDAITVSLPADEVRMYKFKPKKLSYDLYGTVELWAALLELNKMYSTMDLTCEKPFLVFNPETVKEKINEILIQEGVLH
jgi:hypothetical protein